VLQSVFYRIDEVFTRLVDDPPVLKSLLPELALETPQVRLERR
jgi:hypothetical protein